MRPMCGWLIVVAMLSTTGQLDPGEKAITEDHVRALIRSAESQLQDDALWTDPDRRHELLRLMRAVKMMRSEAAGRIFLERLEYTPYTDEKGDFSYLTILRPRLPRHTYPCVGGLIAIGLPVVSQVVDRLAKEEDPKRSELLAYSLFDIYETAGHGMALARHRVELEIPRREGAEKDRLLRALESRYLKPSQP